jgi:hypothetical protein
LVIPSNRSLPPELFRGVSPNDAAICLPLLNCLASPTLATIAVAMIGPTPRSRCNRVATGSVDAAISISDPVP